MVLNLQEFIAFRDEVIEVAHKQGIERSKIKNILNIALHDISANEIDYFEIIDKITEEAKKQGITIERIISILAEATKNRENEIYKIEKQKPIIIEPCVYASPRPLDIEPCVYASPRFFDTEPVVYEIPGFKDIKDSNPLNQTDTRKKK